MARTRKAKNSTEGDTVSAAFDLSALAVDEIDEMPARSSSGSGPTDRFPDNPFVQKLRSSHESAEGERGRALNVPAVHVKNVTAAIRNAADKLAGEGIGTRIVYRWVSHQDADGIDVLVTTAKFSEVPTGPNCSVRIMFEGKDRKRYLTPDEKVDAARFGFYREGSTEKIDSAAYLTWVEAGRPMQSDDVSDGSDPQDYPGEHDNGHPTQY